MTSQNLTASANTETIYCNVMETLVAEAVDRRLKRLPPSKTAYVNRVQLITYALNRVPPLYASSAEGADRQRKRARREFAQELDQAVNHALAAVQRDPLKHSTPLTDAQDESLAEAEAALGKIRQAFKRQDLSWDGVANWVVKAVNRRQMKGGSPAQELAIANRSAVLRRMQVQAQKQIQNQAPKNTENTRNLNIDDAPPISAWDYNNLR